MQRRSQPMTKQQTRIVLGALAALLLGAILLLFLLIPPGRQIEQSLILSPPFSSMGGFAFFKDLPIDAPSDTPTANASNLVLYENNVELTPAHAIHENIRQSGTGAFSHWGRHLYFSATDNSDPNRNGRQYSLKWSAPLSLALYLSLLVVAYFVLLLLAEPLSKRLLVKHAGGWLAAAYISVASLLFLQAASWTLIENKLTESGATIRSWYEYSFEGKPANFKPGESTNYVEHPYLNYAINPAITYGGFQQFNAEYRIRRSEPIRPRDQVRWRVLVLGGSTTFGEMLSRESDTWVFQLEQRVRAVCEPCDVINGGVGGYTVLENFIHYISLLSDLKPDVVLLYEGINDVAPRLFGDIRNDYSNYRIPWRSEGAVLPRPNAALAWLYPYRFYFLSRQILGVQQTGIGGVTSRPYPPSSEWLAALDRNGSSAYKTHLRDLSLLILAQGIRVAIIPQHFVSLSQMDDIFMKGVTQHNTVNLEVAKEFGLPFFHDLVASGTFTRNDTFDNCHFNEPGSTKMADLVFTFLLANKILSVEHR